MEAKNKPQTVEAADKTSQDEDFIYISPLVAAAMAGETVEMGKELAQTPAEKE